MHPKRLLNLIRRAQQDLDEVRREVQVNTEDEETEEKTQEARLRLEALEIRVSAIEKGNTKC